ncbi:MAG: HAMP domain-containing protein [Gammaproteobacteria bacterium]|nr:HAMP domain-containing protein [Gammaproteobacteria bacterium]
MSTWRATESSATEVPRARSNVWLISQFYISMLTVVGIDFCFAIIYEIPLERFLPTAALLVLLTLGGAHIIFRPILRYLLNPADTGVPVRSIATLGRVCTAYMAAVIGVLAFVKFAVLPSVIGFDIDSLLSRNERFWLPVLHTLYYSALTYFVMINYEAGLRMRIFRNYGKLVPAVRGHLLLKLLAAIGMTTLLPIGLIVLHVLERDMVLERNVLIQDIVASALGLCVTFIFVARSLIAPIKSLETALASVRRNDLSVTVPVLSNDETGRLASGFNRMVGGLRERALIRETFGRYIPERIASAVLSAGGNLEPRSAVATVLYADVENFTSIAEQMRPEKVVEMLNEFFSAAVELIENNNGVVTQFQGDAMLATFNLPVDDVHHAESAIRSGMAIQRLCAERRFAGISLRARIGIATGNVTAGNVGSDNRVCYTVHGDAVNLAARLEQLNKRLDSSLLVDEATVDALTSPMPVTFVDQVRIRGKERYVRVYRDDVDASSSSLRYAV